MADNMIIKKSIDLPETITLHRHRLTRIDQNGKQHELPSKEIILSRLDLTFQTFDHSKVAMATLDDVPNPIILFQDEKYEEWIANGKKPEELEDRFRQGMGDTPQAFLQAYLPRTLDSDPHGPGTILAGMLEAVGIKSAPNCSCKRRAVVMNAEGNDWCEENMDTILDWLKEEANKRGLPFIRGGAKLIVSRAIKKSRRLLKKYGST
tara:strand:+ start:2164 stop:2784 length:621 start_codon:yes stop_codon:yes gene_type:complete